MRSRYQASRPDAAYFVTSTIIEWLPVFTTQACCDILADSLSFCRDRKGLKIYGWVIMHNHFHAIVAAPDLSGALADLKKFTARKLVEQLSIEKREWLLNQFSYYRARHKISSHQIWQEGFHPQEILGDTMMLQKLEYLHHNPIRAGLVVAPEHWRYSSAHEWLPGAEPLFRCDDWR